MKERISNALEEIPVWIMEAMFCGPTSSSQFIYKPFMHFLKHATYPQFQHEISQLGIIAAATLLHHLYFFSMVRHQTQKFRWKVSFRWSLVFIVIAITVPTKPFPFRFSRGVPCSRQCLPCRVRKRTSSFSLNLLFLFYMPFFLLSFSSSFSLLPPSFCSLYLFWERSLITFKHLLIIIINYQSTWNYYRESLIWSTFK